MGRYLVEELVEGMDSVNFGRRRDLLEELAVEE